MLLELGGVRLLTDPVLRSRLLHLRRRGDAPGVPERVDAVLLSHLHHDHVDLPSLRRLPPETPVLAPRGARDVLRKAGLSQVRELVAGERLEVGGALVRATLALHGGRRWPFGPRAPALGFLVSGERSVYFAGDTDLFAELADLAPVDVALLPVAGWAPKLGPGHLDPERAARAAALLEARVAVPIHWGTLHARGQRLGSWFHDPGERFAAHAAEVAPDVEVRVLAPGESLEL